MKFLSVSVTEGRSLAGFAGLNAAGSIDVCCECVLSCRGLRDGPISRQEDPYPLCVCVCVIFSVIG